MKQDVKYKSLTCHLLGLVTGSLLLISCGSSEEAKAEVTPGSSVPSTVIPVETPEQQDDTFDTDIATARFLGQSTFGANYQQIQSLTGKSASTWFKEQIAKPASLISPVVAEFTPEDLESDEFNDLYIDSTTFAFWRNSISADDQLRQKSGVCLV